jgi:hypothetical protein
MYQKSVIDHCPWPSSHAQNKLLSSSLIVIGSSPWFTPPSNQRTIVAARLVIYIYLAQYLKWLFMYLNKMFVSFSISTASVPFPSGKLWISWVGIL